MVARFSSGGVAIRYVFPVLRMTSRLAVMGRTATSGVAIPGRSLMSMDGSLYLYCFLRLASKPQNAKSELSFVNLVQNELYVCSSRCIL